MARADRDLPELLVKLCTDSSGVEVAVEWFRDLIGALREFPSRYCAAGERNFVKTAEASKMFEALDYTLRTRSMVLIVGVSGAGKTYNGKVWFDLHRGSARLVELRAACDRKMFFANLAKSFDIGGSYHLQQRVEDFLASLEAAAHDRRGAASLAAGSAHPR